MKTSHITSLLFIVCLLVCSCKEKHENDNKIPATISRYEPGQVWTFHTSTNELPGALLTVARVDIDTKRGPIIYISVTGVRHTTWETTNKFYPFSEGALNRSVIALVRTNALLTGESLEGFQVFYELAHRAVEEGKSDKCFEIPVADVLETKAKGSVLLK